MKHTPAFSFKALAIFALVAIVITSGCKREYDSPPERTLPIGSVLTLQELRNLYVNQPVRFRGDSSVYAVVTADESSGNLYRNIFVQAGEAAINLRLNTPGGLYQGDSIRIYLPGTLLSMYQGMMQLDSVDVDNNIVKLATNVHVAPKLVTVNEVTPDIQGQLIQLDNVEFALSSLCQTYADAVGQNSVDRTITNCQNQNLIVRTSGYANFAGETVPSGNGSLVAIVGQFNNTMQLTIRNINEVNMTGDRCTQGIVCDELYLYKTFNDGSLTSGGWKTKVVQSTPLPHNWETSSAGSNNPDGIYASVSGHNGDQTYSDTELWLISPSVDLSNAQSPGLSFKNAKNYGGPALQLMISSDYDGTSDPSQQGTWIDYTGYASWSIGAFSWTNSGIIPMTVVNGESNVHVAFKYTSTSGGGAATWEIDVIVLDEQ